MKSMFTRTCFFCSFLNTSERFRPLFKKSLLSKKQLFKYLEKWHKNWRKKKNFVSIFMNNGSIISIKNINKSYDVGHNKLHVLKGIDLTINKGEMIAVMGASGSGKSTLLNILGILDNYDNGEYYLDGTFIHDLSETKAAYYRNRFIGFVFQSFNLISFKNAMENVALPLYYQKVSRKQRNKLALEYLDKMGLREWATHLPNELSGGQKQRIAIARSLISNPKVILADEPTGMLDSKTSQEVMDILEDINKQGITIILVTHEHDIAERTKRIIHLKDGVIEQDYFKVN
jgi:putative ABC transport system ATP-binding protein